MCACAWARCEWGQRGGKVALVLLRAAEEEIGGSAVSVSQRLVGLAA